MFESDVGSFLITLTILWFLVYWIFGGVVFSIISLLRPGKMKRVRFSCLYTILSGAVAYGAARLGIFWASRATGSVPKASSVSEAITVLGGLGFVGVLLGLIAGLIVLFIGGWVVMLISRRRERSWYERAEQEEKKQ